MNAEREPRLEFARMRLLVDDFDRSWRFYRDVLGLIPVTGHGAPPYGEFVSPAGAVVSLFEHAPMAQALGLFPAGEAKEGRDRGVLVLETTDVDALARALRRKGARLETEPTDRPDWGIRTVHLRDPDGNLIEIYSEARRDIPAGTAEADRQPARAGETSGRAPSAAGRAKK